MVFEVFKFATKRKGMGGVYHTQQARATKCGGWVMRGWGTLESVRNNLGPQNVGDGVGGGGVRGIGRATTSSRKITREMGQLDRARNNDMLLVLEASSGKNDFSASVLEDRGRKPFYHCTKT